MKKLFNYIFILTSVSALTIGCASTDEEFTNAQYEAKVEQAMHEDTDRMMSY